MYRLKDAKVFVESLNEEQRRALAEGLMLGQEAGTTLIATRLCEAVLLAGAVRHVALWKNP